MARIDTESSLKVYVHRGQESKGLGYPKLRITSHWNDRDRVTLHTPDGETIEVVADDLHAAIRATTVQP